MYYFKINSMKSEQNSPKKPKKRLFKDFKKSKSRLFRNRKKSKSRHFVTIREPYYLNKSIFFRNFVYYAINAVL